MATPNFFVHLITFLCCPPLFFILSSYFPVKSVAWQSHFETVETVLECSRPLTDPKERPQSTIEVFHRYGPCSTATGKSPMNMPSQQDILDLDRRRVQSLQARFNPNPKTNKYNSARFRFQETKEVANLPAMIRASFFGINISLGTPGQELTLAVDTSSDITWTRCFLINPQIMQFNPNASNSFSNIPCVNSTLCSQLVPSHNCDQLNNTQNICFHDIQYDDGSHSKGAFSMDKLTITQTGDVFPNFLFLSTTEISGDRDLYYVDGVLGLGRGTASFLNQTEQTYGGMFSYCLPTTLSSPGFLKLGRRNYPNDVKFTPLIMNSDHPSFYFINITSISVGKVQLSINPFDFMNPGTIIDSATMISRLPMNAYVTMRDEFKNQMSNSGYRVAQDSVYTCFDTSNHSAITVPTISFTFDGGATVDLDASTTLFTMSITTKCLAFRGNSDPGDLAIFANTQQMKYEVVYDVDGEKLGFIPGGCV